MKTPKKILIVDDEETLCEALRFNLEAAGYEAHVAYSAEEALTLPLESFSLILLDIMMEGISGTQMAERLKKDPATASVPIIFCTAKDAEDEMVKGLQLGADDYITKPYSLRNVLARVEAVLRRTENTAGAKTDTNPLQVTYKGMVLYPNKKSCLVDGQDLKLSRKEFEILLLLVSNRGKVFSRADVLKKAWPDEVTVINRVVDVHVARLRQKLGSYGKNIITRSGYGYVFVE